MASRVELHEYLCSILGTRYVYFQPPETIKLQYPAILYSLTKIKNNSADDEPYLQKRAYSVIVIDKSPDSLVSDKLSKVRHCSFDRAYPSDGLNHFVYTIYY